MVTLVFESHGTTTDNENRLASGQFDNKLSKLGLEQSKELGQRYQTDKFDAIFCSDLQRSFKTAEIAFGNKFPIIKDVRLRECNYGDFNRKPSDIVDKEKPKRIITPFPKGESYNQCAERMKGFLNDLLKNYNGKKLMVIGHRATQYGLEHWIKGIPLKEIITTSWSWQPGWTYKFNRLRSTRLKNAKPYE